VKTQTNFIYPIFGFLPSYLGDVINVFEYTSPNRILSVISMVSSIFVIGRVFDMFGLFFLALCEFRVSSQIDAFRAQGYGLESWQNQTVFHEHNMHLSLFLRFHVVLS
jgi:hypothetical protein